MPPNLSNASVHSLQKSAEEESNIITNDKYFQKVGKPNNRKYEIVWGNVIITLILHGFALYGMYLCFTAEIATIIFAFLMHNVGALGITAGVHRLWSHRSYKAKLPLRVFLVFAQTLAQQTSVIQWARDHRGHHKYEETNADPHNVLNGFFFSHMGWLMCKKHKDVTSKGKGIDLSDLYADPLLRFQQKYYIPLALSISMTMPTVVPMFMWNETFLHAFSLNILRYVSLLHVTWLVNSWAHMWGNKPYDKDIKATQCSFISILTLGEGWHNFHHSFPWDYRTSEFGKLNFTLKFINMCAKIGLAYDLKTASTDMIKNKVNRCGDGTHEIWGWGDKDQSSKDMKNAIIYNKKDD